MCGSLGDRLGAASGDALGRPWGRLGDALGSLRGALGTRVASRTLFVHGFREPWVAQGSIFEPKGGRQKVPKSSQTGKNVGGIERA